MTDKLIEQIKADRKAGTKSAKADWSTDAYGKQRHTTRTAYADTARRDRVPEMEARILADTEALKAADAALEQAHHALNVAPAFADKGATEYAVEKFNDLDAAYRKARENNDGTS